LYERVHATRVKDNIGGLNRPLPYRRQFRAFGFPGDGGGQHRRTGAAPVRKIIYVALAVTGISTLLFILGIFALEHSRVQNLCRSAHSRVESAHDAINAIRNYRVDSDSSPVGLILSRVRQSEAFQSDGYSTFIQNDDGYRYRKGGGWRVEQWDKPLISRGYTVDFEYFDLEFQPNVEVKCDVLECGAIDVPNCLTFGAFYAQ
jgi:hypothetical protein